MVKIINAKFYKVDDRRFQITEFGEFGFIIDDDDGTSVDERTANNDLIRHKRDHCYFSYEEARVKLHALIGEQIIKHMGLIRKIKSEIAMKQSDADVQIAMLNDQLKLQESQVRFWENRIVESYK